MVLLDCQRTGASKYFLLCFEILVLLLTFFYSKYHSRALVFNTKNLIRIWDIGYDGYNGGKDDRVVDWSAEAPGCDRPFNQAVSDMSTSYNGPSLMVMKFNVNTNSRDYRRNWPRYVICFSNLFSFS